jgi:hypothetical protein
VHERHQDNGKQHDARARNGLIAAREQVRSRPSRGVKA